MKYRFLTLAVLVFSILGLTVAASSSNSTLFQPVNPREEATVSISFDGLMALCFGSPERVSVGILDVEHHTPTLKIMKLKGKQQTEVATLKGEQLRGVLNIDLSNENSASISRYYASDATDPNDFRWTVDFEEDLHQKELHLREDKLFGRIHISSGLYYSQHLTDQPVRFMSNDGKALPFFRRIAEPAAKINVPIGEALIIKSDKETIRLVAEPGVRYQLDLTNVPPPEHANMNHWLYYYSLINEKLTPYAPIVIEKAAFAPIPHPCEPGVFSKAILN